MMSILIAHSNAEMRQVLHQSLFAAFADPDEGAFPQIIETSNKAEALIHCAAVDFDFVVISLGLAADLTKPVSDRQGLDLLRLLRERQLQMPVVLIAPTMQPEIEQNVVAHSATVLYEDDVRPTLDDAIVRRAKCFPNHLIPPALNRLDIEINLAESTFRIKDQLGRMPAAATGRLVVRPEQLAPRTKELLDRVRAEQPDWEELLRQLGADLRDELFTHPPNLDFRDEYTRARAITGLPEDAARIRFVIGEREQHTFPLEALLTRQKDMYWMLQAPLFRTVKRYPKARPLFEDPLDRRYPINCLLVSADTFGNVDKLQRTFPPIRRTKEECNAIREKLERERQSLNIGRIRVLSNDEPMEENSSCWENLQRVLRAEAWHLVHFAGHSYYDEKKRYGCLLLPERLSQTPEPIEASNFASAFGDTPQFVYLNSCESSADEFVFELATIGIPAVAGFRWNVTEDSAFEYAMSFYEHLLRERNLEVAFWKARRDTHENSALDHNLIWAAAMLIIQTDR